jgi:hypothetical protein
MRRTSPSKPAADPPAPLPGTSLVRRNGTHRLILAKYSLDDASVLARIASDQAHLEDIFDLDGATNDRLLAERSRFAGIDVDELVFAVPHCRIINAAFTHPHVSGSRFNGPDRGAWYAAFDLKTAQAEIAFHKTTEYAEIGRFEDSVTYDDYQADFSANFHDLRGAAPFEACLDPESYVASQLLAQRLLDSGSLGIVYPSVRRARGTCVSCFRPALVGNVRRGQRYRFTWSGSPVPAIAAVPPSRT